MASAMLHAKNLPYQFWVEDMNTSCHFHNRVTIRPETNVTHYELWKGRKSIVKYFHVLAANVTSLLIQRKYARWILKLIKEYSWDTLE